MNVSRPLRHYGNPFFSMVRSPAWTGSFGLCYSSLLPVLCADSRMLIQIYI